MKPCPAHPFRFLLAVTILCTGVLFCAKSPTQTVSGGTEGGNVVGKIRTDDGGQGSNTHVELVPGSHDPFRNGPLPDSLKDTTDETGSYSFFNVARGTYNIQAVHLSNRTRLLVKDIVTDSGTVEVGEAFLYAPGTIRLLFDQRVDTADGYVYVQGTTIHKPITQADLDSGMVMIDSVPVGFIPQIYYSDHDSQSQQIPLGNNVEVKSGDTTSVDSIPTYVAAKAPSAPVIDGLLDEYAGFNAITLVNIFGTRGIYTILYDSTALYIAGNVIDKSVEATRTARDDTVWIEDAIETFFDVENDRSRNMDSNDYKFMVNPLNTQLDGRTNTGNSHGWNGVFQSAALVYGTLNDSTDIDSGYTIEIAIPWSTLSRTPPQPGEYIGFDIALRDKKTDQNTGAALWANTVEPAIFNNPDGWGRIVFGN